MAEVGETDIRDNIVGELLLGGVVELAHALLPAVVEGRAPGVLGAQAQAPEPRQARAVEEGVAGQGAVPLPRGGVARKARCGRAGQRRGRPASHHQIQR